MRALPYIVSAAVYGVVFLVIGYLCHTTAGTASGSSAIRYWLVRSSEVPMWFVLGALIGAALHWLKLQRN